MADEPRKRVSRTPRAAPASWPAGSGSGSAESTILMTVDRATREAYREGDMPEESGPLFFTSREKLEACTQEEAIEEYEAHPVPAGIVERMKGRPHWVDGERR